MRGFVSKFALTCLLFCTAAVADGPENVETIHMIRCAECDVTSSEDLQLRRAIEQTSVIRWVNEGHSNGVVVVSNQNESVTWYYLSDKGRLLQIGKLKHAYVGAETEIDSG
jgi:hypothetical protein